MALLRQLQSEGQIFDDARSHLRRRAEHPERHRHSGPGQVNPPCKPLQSALSDEVLEHEGEGGKLHQRRGVAVGAQKVDRLRRSARRRSTFDQRPKAWTVDRAIGIQHDEDVGRRRGQAVHREGERVAFSGQLRVVPLDHLHARHPGAFRSRVRAIVGDDQDARVVTGCFPEALQRGGDHRLLVMRRNRDYG